MQLELMSDTYEKLGLHKKIRRKLRCIRTLRILTLYKLHNIVVRIIVINNILNTLISLSYWLYNFHIVQGNWQKLRGSILYLWTLANVWHINLHLLAVHWVRPRDFMVGKKSGDEGVKVYYIRDISDILGCWSLI